jgi:phytoene synthase
MIARGEPVLLPQPAEENRSTGLDLSYARCRAIAKEHSKTFYFASLFMNHEQRRAIWAVYAFCRTADDLVDSSASARLRLAAIDRWHDEVLAAYEGQPRHELTVALADAVRRFGIPLQPALDLLRGARKDVTVRRYETYGELQDYCYLVASTVGLLTCPIFGYEPGALEYGVALGRAMQMTNILRDVGEDARMGRIYLPAEDLRSFGYPEAALLSGVVDERFVALMKFQIERVRELYDLAAPGIELLAPGSRYTVRVALRLYRKILVEIERNGYDVFTRRAFVPLRTKLVMAARVAFGP